MRFLKSLCIAAALLFVLAACTATENSRPDSTEKPLQQQDEINQEASAAIPPTQLPFTGATYPIKLRITTTSDWTNIRLVGGAAWDQFVITSASSSAETAAYENGVFSLSQSVSQASSDKSLELEAEGLIASLNPENPILIEIDRGYIGATQIEIYRYLEGEPSLVTVLTWDGSKQQSENTQVYQLSPQPFLANLPNEHIVIAQLNFWYYGSGIYGGFENGDGSRNTALTPLLGKAYAAADPDVVYQQIEWAVEYGVDAFSIEWTTPRGEGCCGSMEDTLDDVFLKSPNIHKVHWAIFYDFILRLNQTPELGNPPTNFDLPEVYDTFVNDFVHFAEKYFSNPQYLSIDGRPVIYIWASNSFTGNFAGAMQEARERVAELGFDVFIVGDEVCYRCFRPDHAALFDGSSTFTFLIPGVDIRQLDDVGEAAETTDIAFAWWRDQLAGLQVTGREELVNFQPAWAPQYDERLVEGRENNPIYVPANSIDQVIEMATVARKHVEPTGSQDMKLVWVNTWNCWAETTTIAPTADDGPKYPAGNYQFDFLEVIRDIFGAETYYTAPVP